MRDNDMKLTGAPSQTNNYDFVAFFYDALAGVFSGFQIKACKRFQVEWIEPGDSVLYAGAGGAEDAIMAANKGARVTIVELSVNMVNKARKKIQAQGLQDRINIIHGDVLQHASENYDVVVANFFLNVFERSTMQKVLSHLVTLTRPNGKVMIADFAPLNGNILLQGLQQVYYGLALFTFAALASNPLHKIYDYCTLLNDNGLQKETIKDMGLLDYGPKWYRVIIAKKKT